MGSHEIRIYSHSFPGPWTLWLRSISKSILQEKHSIFLHNRVRIILCSSDWSWKCAQIPQLIKNRSQIEERRIWVKMTSLPVRVFKNQNSSGEDWGSSILFEGKWRHWIRVNGKRAFWMWGFDWFGEGENLIFGKWRGGA